MLPTCGKNVFWKAAFWELSYKNIRIRKKQRSKFSNFREPGSRPETLKSYSERPGSISNTRFILKHADNDFRSKPCYHKAILSKFLSQFQKTQAWFFCFFLTKPIFLKLRTVLNAWKNSCWIKSKKSSIFFKFESSSQLITSSEHALNQKKLQKTTSKFKVVKNSKVSLN